MTIKQGEKLLKEFIQKCEQDKDVFLTVHFSREEDKFNGFFSDEMDEFDAGIIIKYLVKKFNIPQEVLLEFSNEITA